MHAHARIFQKFCAHQSSINHMEYITLHVCVSTSYTYFKITYIQSIHLIIFHLFHTIRFGSHFGLYLYTYIVRCSKVNEGTRSIVNSKLELGIVYCASVLVIRFNVWRESGRHTVTAAEKTYQKKK